jgi:hypothetical protein
MPKLINIWSSLAALALVIAAPAAAVPLKGPIKPLELLVGCWTGEGYITRGKRVEVTVRECFEPRVDGSQLVAEPTYHARQPDGVSGERVHGATAIFSATVGGPGVSLWNLSENGMAIRRDVTVDGRRLGFEDAGGPGRPPQRWTMEIGADGTIHEYMEGNRNGSWERFFEIRLKRAPTP